MGFIEETFYLRNIPSILPGISERWIDDSMPDLDITRFRRISRSEIFSRKLIEDESLIIEVDIRENTGC